MGNRIRYRWGEKGGWRYIFRFGLEGGGEGEGGNTTLQYLQYGKL
jgi:hypothetical protein